MSDIRSDTIKRSDAIKHLKNWFHSKGWMVSDEDCKSILWDIPSADRPQGEWIALDERDVSGCWKCSACGTPTHAIGAKAIYKYCPFCGADMKGADDFARTHEVVANGNCAICGKPLSGDKVFICEECSKKGANDDC